MGNVLAAMLEARERQARRGQGLVWVGLLLVVVGGVVGWLRWAGLKGRID